MSRHFSAECERRIIALAIDEHLFFLRVYPYCTPDIFRLPECRCAMDIILDFMEPSKRQQHDLTREKLCMLINEHVAHDDNRQKALDVVNTPLEEEHAADTRLALFRYARARAQDNIWSQEMWDAHHRGDWQTTNRILEDYVTLMRGRPEGIHLIRDRDRIMDSFKQGRDT